MSLAGLADGEPLPAPPFLGVGGRPSPNPPSPTTLCFGAGLALVPPEEDGGEGFASLVAFAAAAVAAAAVASAAVVVAAALDATAEAIALAALARLVAASFSVVVVAMAASSSLRTHWACRCC